jgi:hypothetical protein
VRHRALLLAVSLLVLLGDGLGLVATRVGDDGAAGGTKRGGRPGPAPSEPGLATLPAPDATHPTGRGRGLPRVIPCYLLTAGELHRVLDAPMTDLGQRAAGSSGFGLTGMQREDCHWFSTRPDGPYVVLSTVTTTQLHDRGQDLTARKYFDTVHGGPRTYLRGIGDAAYAFGPASVGVLVGDVYLEVTVVTNDGHPLRDARRLAALMSRLRVHSP